MPPPLVGILWIFAILCIAALVLWGWMSAPIPEPFKTIGKIFFVVIFGIWLIWSIFGVISSLGSAGWGFPTPYQRGR
jgi:hypothetical protein